MAEENKDKPALERVVNLLVNKRYDEALMECDTELKKDPENKGILMIRGDIIKKKDNNLEAKAGILEKVGKGLAAYILREEGTKIKDKQIKISFLERSAVLSKEIGRYEDSYETYKQLMNETGDYLKYGKESKAIKEEFDKMKENVLKEAKKNINGDFSYDSKIQLFNWGTEQIRLCEERGLYGLAVDICRELYRNLNSNLSEIKNCEELKKKVCLEESRCSEKMGLFEDAIKPLLKMLDCKEKIDEEKRLKEKIKLLEKNEIQNLVQDEINLGLLEKQESKRTSEVLEIGDISLEDARTKIQEGFVNHNQTGHLDGMIEYQYNRYRKAHPELNHDLAQFYFSKGNYDLALDVLIEQKNKAEGEEKITWQERENGMLSEIAEMEYKKGKYANALKTIRKQDNKLEAETALWEKIAEAFHEKGNFMRSMIIYKKFGNKEKEEQELLEIAKIRPEKRDLMIRLYEGQERWLDLVKFNKEIKNYAEAARICREKLGDSSKERIELMNLAKYLHDNGEHKEAGKVYRNLYEFVLEAQEYDSRGATVIAAKKMEKKLGINPEKYLPEAESYWKKIGWFRRAADMHKKFAEEEKEKSVDIRIKLKKEAREKAEDILDEEKRKEEAIDLFVSKRLNQKINEKIKGKDIHEISSHEYSILNDSNSAAVHLERIKVYEEQKKQDKGVSSRYDFKIAEAYLRAGMTLNNVNIKKETLQGLGYNIEGLKDKSKEVVKRLGFKYRDFIKEMQKYKENEEYGVKRTKIIITNYFDI